MTGRLLARRLRRDDAGLTMIELLVASSLFLLLSGIVLGATTTTSRVAEGQRVTNDLNEEARVLLNRISRELREATEVRSVVNPVGVGYDPSGNSQITFWVDLDGNGSDVVAPGGDPEVITYRYQHDPAGGRVFLEVPGATEPVLAGQVTRFDLTYTSRNYLYDGRLGGAKDGTVSWEELDSVPAGSAVGNGTRVLDAELASIDSVRISFSVFKEPRTQSYQTQIALRNAS